LPQRKFDEGCLGAKGTAWKTRKMEISKEKNKKRRKIWSDRSKRSELWLCKRADVNGEE
jgi:hypothetical protein